MHKNTEGALKIVARSEAKAPSFQHQLTVWCDARQEIQFALDQLDRHHAPWRLKESLGKVAVFVPGEKDSDPVHAW